MEYDCYIHGIWVLFAILLRILTTSSERYIDITRIAYPPSNSRSSGHHCTLNVYWKFRDLDHSCTIASRSTKDTFNILWCSWYIPCISWYIDVYTCIYMVYTMYILIYRCIYFYKVTATSLQRRSEKSQWKVPVKSPSIYHSIYHVHGIYYDIHSIDHVYIHIYMYTCIFIAYIIHILVYA